MTMKTEKRYHGVVVPMVTPVTREGDIDVPAVERIVANMAEHGVSQPARATLFLLDRE